VDATVVRLVLVPALMAMFAQWNWWLPRWLARILPSVDFDRPLPEVDLSDIVVIPADFSALPAPSGDLRKVVKSAAKLQHLAPDAIRVVDPLAFTGCGCNGHKTKRALGPRQSPHQVEIRAPKRLARNGNGRIAPVHPVTLWRGRLSVAIDALQAQTDYARQVPLETSTVQLPTGDQLQVPTGAEALRLKGYLIMCRNSRRDYAEFADMVDTLECATVALVLAGMDTYYSWPMATQLFRRLADPHPTDLTDDQPSKPAAKADWENVRQRCMSVTVAMLEEAK